MVLAILILSVLIGRNALPGRSVIALRVGLSAVLLASLALTGHARSEEGGIGVVHVIADGLHLLAAGLWLGGLFGLSLLLMLTCSGREEEVAIVALRRFSGSGFLAVALLIVTGAVNTALLVGSPEALISTAYGRLLLCKLGLFSAMLALAAANRFNLVPRLGEAKPSRAAVLATLQRHVLLEQIAGSAVLMIVSALGTLAPPA